jgi:hypothetical protein
MKRVLMIAYIYPPQGGSGVQRTVKFVRYLPSYGWEPLVLTVREPYDDNATGDHAVIGAGSVVTRDVPAGSIAAGNPATVVRMR